MGIFVKKRWQSALVAFVFAFTSVTTLFTQSASAVAGDIEPWQQATNSLPAGRAASGTVESNGYLYSIGGRGGINEEGVEASPIVRYSQINTNGIPGTWTNTTNLPSGTDFVSSLAHNNRIYVVGDRNVGNDTYRSVLYHAAINTNGSLGSWTTVELPAPKYLSGAVIVGSYLYIIGGVDFDDNDSEYRDITPPVYYAELQSNGSVGSWTTSNIESPGLLAGPDVVAHNGNIYLLGGGQDYYDGNLANQSVYYTSVNSDGSINAWINSGKDLPDPRPFSASIVIDDRIYIMGGATDVTGNHARDSVLFTKINSDGSIQDWETSSNPLPQGKVALSIAEAGNRIYLIGGWGSYDMEAEGFDTSQSASVYYTSVTPQSLPAPTSLSALSPTNQKPALTWTGVAGATSYTVYRNGNSVGTSSTTSFTDTALSADGDYTYTVAAANGSITSPQSNSISVQYDATVPTATNPTISGWLVVNWGNPVISANASDALSGVTGGEYYIDNDPGQGNGSAMTYANGKISAQPIITTGTANGWHTIYMRSKDAAGNWSTPTSVRFFFF